MAKPKRSGFSMKVTVATSTYALFGRHIYVTITGGGRRYEYRAINIIDARSFIERTLATEFQGWEVEVAGDTEIYFVSRREGD